MRYSFGDFLLDEKTGSVTHTLNGEELKLRPQTYRLLEVLVKNYPKIMPRDRLLDLVWGTEHVSSGSLPQAISELRQVLGDDPQQAKFIATVHRRGYRFIKPVSVASTMIFLRPQVEKALQKKQAETLENWRQRLPMVAIVLLASLVVLSALIFAHRVDQQAWNQKKPATISQNGPRTSVAVVDFRDLASNPETKWLSSALSEMFATELTLDERLRIVPSGSVADATADLKFGARSLSELSKLHLRLGIDLLVVGNYLLLSGHPAQLRLDLRLIDVRRQQTLLTLSETSHEDEMLSLVARLGERLRGQLLPVSERMIHSSTSGEKRVTRPMRLFFEGQAARQRFDPTKARELLSQAAALAPDSPRIAIALARVLLDLGEEERAREATAPIRDQLTMLTEEEQLTSEGLLLELAGEREAAMEVFRGLSQRFPDQPEHALNYARAQIAAGRSQDLLEQLDELRRLFQTPATTVRLDLLEAEAAAAISELKRQEEAARRAVKTGRELGAPWLVGQALLALSQAVGRQGDPVEAVSLAEEARSLFAESQDQHRVAATLNELAARRFDLGHLEASRNLAQEALELAARLGNQKIRGRALRQLARSALHGGEAELGWERLRQADDLYLATGDRLGRASVLALESRLLLHEGDIAEAIEKNTLALEIFAELGDRYQQAESQQMTGNLLARISRLDDALVAWEKAAVLYQQVGDRRGEVATSSRIATVYTARGQLSEARELLTQALAYHRSTGSSRDTARTLYDLALVDLPTGRPEQAKAALVEGLQIFEQIGDQLGMCFVQRKLGDTLYHLGELDNARRRLEEALATCRVLEHRIGEALAANNLGFVALAQGRLDEARKILETARLLHAAMGDVGNEATDRFGLARVEFAAGDLVTADQQVNQAIKVYAAKHSPDLLALARSLRGHLLIVQGRSEEARAVLEDAASNLMDTQNVLLSMEAQIWVHQARAILDQDAASWQTLREIATRARALGYEALAFMARLAEIDSTLLGQEEQRRLAEELAREAKAAGFELIALQAQERALSPA